MPDTRIVWALEKPKMGGEGNNLASLYYTPLYEKGIKETRNKSMETTCAVILTTKELI